jgi:hypothetical protein
MYLFDLNLAQSVKISDYSFSFGEDLILLFCYAIVYHDFFSYPVYFT